MQRQNPHRNEKGFIVDMVPDDKGRYVLFSEAQAKIEAAEKRAEGFRQKWG